jgi:AcrR family transcriptional regulator
VPRRRSASRLDDVIAASIRVFQAKGYRRAQMADVARELGLTAGALYGYVESKAALFDLVVRRGFVSEPSPPPALPVPTPDPGSTLAHLRERFARELALPRLDAALAARRAPADARAELAGIVRELFDLLARHRDGILVIDRSALDWPELASAYLFEARRSLIERLARFLERRMASGRLRRAPDAAAAARFVLESCAWWAMHRHGDPDPLVKDDALAQDCVVDAIVHAFAPPETP